MQTQWHVLEEYQAKTRRRLMAMPRAQRPEGMAHGGREAGCGRGDGMAYGALAGAVA